MKTYRVNANNKEQAEIIVRRRFGNNIKIKKVEVIRRATNSTVGDYRFHLEIMNCSTDFNCFFIEVKKLFPNATKNKVLQVLGNGNSSFTYDYGGVSELNMPDVYHNRIKRINKMAGSYRKDRGFALKDRG